VGLRSEDRVPSPNSQLQAEPPLEVSVNCTGFPWAGNFGEKVNEGLNPLGGGVPGGVGIGVGVRVGMLVAVGVGIGKFGVGV